MSFPKIVNQMGPFGQKRKNSVFRFCRPILDIFRFTLLNLVLKIAQATNSPFCQSVGRDAKERMVSRNRALIERVPQTSLNQLDGVK